MLIIKGDMSALYLPNNKVKCAMMTTSTLVLTKRCKE